MQLGTTEAKVPLPLQGNPAIVIHADSGRKSRTWRLPQTRGSKVLFKEQPVAPELQEDEEDGAGILQLFISGEYAPSIAEIYIDFVVMCCCCDPRCGRTEYFAKNKGTKQHKSRARGS